MCHTFSLSLSLSLSLPSLCRCAVGYEGNNPKNPLILLGSGKGTVEDIREFCKEDNAVYGLFRVVGGDWRLLIQLSATAVLKLDYT